MNHKSGQEMDFFSFSSLEENVQTAIRKWSCNNPNIPRLAVTDLLHHLNPLFPSLPMTYTTLMKGDAYNKMIIPMYNGRYSQILNFNSALIKHLELIADLPDNISLNLNVDGIPLFNDSRKHHAYPILVQVCTHPSKVLCYGVYVSETNSNKMPPVNIFLENFVNELSILIKNGLVVKEKKITFTVKAFVCDAPARAALKKIVNHNSYNGCERCQQKGSYAGGHVALLETDAPKRTDQSFQVFSDPPHHTDNEVSILNKLGIGFVSTFVLDYMHLVCIGVMKRWLGRLKNSRKLEKKCHVSSHILAIINEHIKQISRMIPSEFSRKLSGGLDSLAHWKATELRIFLLYVGPIVLKNNLPKRQYTNFLYLCAAMRLLLTPGQNENLENIRLLLKTFIETAKTIFGKSFISYNVHAVLHLPDDYYNFGPLDNVSCFTFENYLGTVIKNRLTGRNKVLEQVSNNVFQENAQDQRIRINLNKKQIKVGHFFVRKNESHGRDNCIMIKTGDIAFIRDFTNDWFEIECFSHKENLFTHPVESKDIGIFLVKGPLIKSKISLSNIHSKMFLVPFQDNFIACQILHTSAA